MTEEIEVQDQAARDAAARVADYEHGWSADIETDFAPKGLNEDTVRFISAKKNEPEWMLEWRLKAFRHWLTMEEPNWAKLGYPRIDYQDAYYYAAPKVKAELASLDELDPEIKAVYDLRREDDALLPQEGDGLDQGSVKVYSLAAMVSSTAASEDRQSYSRSSWR